MRDPENGIWDLESGWYVQVRYQQKSGLINFWIDEALQQAKQNRWPKQIKNLKQYGIDEVIVGISPDAGVGTFFQTKGPQVFRWYKDQWNPAVR